MSALSPVLIALMKGITTREEEPEIWQALLDLQARAREYVAVLGLELMLDEVEGYAYLRQRVAAEGEPELPRLVARRQLSYPVSLMLALLRKKLAEFDAGSGEARLILSAEQISDMMRLFLAETGNEARLMDRIDTDIRKIVEMGFLRKLRGNDDRYEVRRILKSYVDAQWLAQFEQRLSEYKQHITGEVRDEAV
uniref:Cytoplasmic protein n=1 Tax=Solibacter usitatus (strain Ellin6076) TaxID=234267 RepID=Q02A79_SOLUE